MKIKLIDPYGREVFVMQDRWTRFKVVKQSGSIDRGPRAPRRSSRARSFARTFACLVFAPLAACGGAPPPNDHVVASESAIRVAEEVGAAKDPKGELYLQLARTQLEEAKALIEDGENEAATRLLLRAEVDADLARAVAKQRHSEAEAGQAKKELEELKKKAP